MDKELEKISENSWLMWSKHVLMTLEFQNKCLNEIKAEQKKQIERVARLEVKAGFWGFIGGAIPVSLALIVWLVRSKMLQ